MCLRSLALPSGPSSATSRSVDVTVRSRRHSVGRFRCSRRCRSHRYSEFRRSRAWRFRFRRCRAYRRSSSQGCRCPRDQSLVPCLAPDLNDCRGLRARTRDRPGPKPRPDHTGIGQRQRGRRTRRHAHAIPRRHPPLKASFARCSRDPTILAQARSTVCCGSEFTRDRDTPIRQMIRRIVLGCTIGCFFMKSPTRRPGGPPG